MGSVEEAQLAIRFGASAIGLVSAMPSGPGVIYDTLIAEIARTIPPGVASFLLTSKHSSAEIIHQQRRSGANTIQICDHVDVGCYNELRNGMPGIKIVQVLHVRGEESIDESRNIAPYVDALLLDSGNPSLPIKELGGTGRVHDWNISRAIVEAVSVPVYLAGGLNAANVAEAIRQVQPFGVDVCSGVRTDGFLDEEKLILFFDKFHMSVFKSKKVK